MTFPAKSEESRLPLQGIRVLDFSWVWAGPLTTKPLADYGAEVIRVESCHRPDLWRTRGPFMKGKPGINRNGMFLIDNTGKLTVNINLGKPQGTEVAKGIITKSDIVVENFAGGVMEKMGLGYEDLCRINPGIIMLSTCMFGHNGPMSRHPGWGFQLAAMVGFNQITGWPDRNPAVLGSYTDFIVPHFNTTAILAALEYRRQTGKGLYLDMSQYENSLYFQAPALLDFQVNGVDFSSDGNRHTQASPHGAFRCRGDDRWLALNVASEEQWKAFLGVLGNPAWSSEPRFSSLSGRKQSEDELERLIESLSINQGAEELMMKLQDFGIAAGVLNNAEDIMEHDPRLKHGSFFREVEHAEVGIYRASRPPYVISGIEPKIKPAPLWGENNEYVLRDVAGYSDEEISDLIIGNVIE